MERFLFVNCRPYLTSEELDNHEIRRAAAMMFKHVGQLAARRAGHPMRSATPYGCACAVIFLGSDEGRAAALVTLENDFGLECESIPSDDIAARLEGMRHG